MYKKFLFALIISASFIIQSCEKDEETDPTTPVLSIGDFHEGGVIFYLDNTGEHGMVCAIKDQSFEADWGCPSLSINGADGKEIGMGAQNTIDIIAQCSETGIAAKLCDNYEFDGYTDWFLPSIDELSLIEQNKAIIDETSLSNNGNVLGGTEYWSSTEFNANSVWVEHLSAGDPFGVVKENTKYNVRSVRTF